MRMRKRMLVLLLAAAICMGGCGQRPGGTEPVANMEEDEEQKDSGAEQNRKEDGSDAASEGTDNTEGEDGNIVSGEPASGAEEEKGIVQAKGLAELYQENFPIGIALSGYILQNTEQYGQVILENFNSITCENEMKPDSLLDQAASQANLEDAYLHAAVHFDNCMPAVKFASEHGMKIRFHTLVWHSQTPKWFFTEDYTDEGRLVDRDVMLARMENYIADVLGYFQENYPGLVYAVDVVNEAFDVGDGDETGIRMNKNLWYETVGADYYYQAFVFARKYASKDMKLFYNDYGCMDKADLILEHLARAREEGLIDGIGMQSHLSTDDKIQHKFMLAVKKFCDAGYEVQATELDIGVKEDSDSAFLLQGRKYRSFFKNMKALQEEGYPVTGITVWGLNDDLSWRRDEKCLLFDGDMNPKNAYLGAMMDPSIPDVE
jgi:GH35 family endo-1,4-beta-xylanase